MAVFVPVQRRSPRLLFVCTAWFYDTKYSRHRVGLGDGISRSQDAQHTTNFQDQMAIECTTPTGMARTATLVLDRYLYPNNH